MATTTARRYLRVRVTKRLFESMVLALGGAALVSCAPASTTNPLAGATFYVGAQSEAATTAAAWRSSDPTGAALMKKIAKQPQAMWFGDWNPAARIASVVSGVVAQTGTRVPTFVLYAIPQRDCGGLSAGGLKDAAAYHKWVKAFTVGLGSKRAVVILEPDALASMNCLTVAAQSAREAMLRDAVTVLKADRAATVYLDAGNSGWQPVPVMAARLRASGALAARGFSINVAQFFPTRTAQTYGDALSKALSGAHYVVDTSRNGRGPAANWCNPPGQALGARPTTVTGDSRNDALLWVKVPGESDGACNGSPPSGTWWPAYARGLAQRATW